MDNTETDLEEGLSLSVSGPSSMGSNFSASSSMYDSLSPPSGRSTPQRPVEFSTAYSNTMQFDFSSPPTAHGTAYMGHAFEHQMGRTTYMEGSSSDGYPPIRARRNLSESDAFGGFDYSTFLESPMNQTFQAQVSSSYGGTLVDTTELRSHSFDASQLTSSTVRMPEMGEMAPYPIIDSSLIRRTQVLSLGRSDSEPGASQTLVSPVDTISSPEMESDDTITPRRRRAYVVRRAAQRSAARRARQASGSGNNGESSLGPIEIRRISPGGNRCEFPGCHKAFNRKEHLKRHEST